VTVVPAPTMRHGSVWLITPGTMPHRFDNARTSGAAVALLDLEDSVDPAEKDTARATAIDWLSTAPAAGEPALGLRINAVGTRHGLRDLLAVVEAGLRHAVLVVPKVQSSRDIELVAEVLDDLTDGVQGGDSDDLAEPARIWALIETPLAIARLPRILPARPLAGVVFGSADYAAAAGCARTSDALRYPRSVLVAAAAAAGVPAIDGPCFDLDDTAALHRETEEARDLGFVGKGAVHPAQVKVIQDAFRPAEQELAAARAVVAAANSAANRAVSAVDGRMVGPPLVAAARGITARAGDPSTAPDSGGQA
jgi:citrate lyase beta subunit